MKLRFNKIKLNFFLDIGLLIAFVVDMEYRFTGLRLHELIGLAFTIIFALHILLHWDWIWSVTKTLFRKLLQESRLNYLLNWLLFLDALMLVVSGLIISRTLGLNLQGVGRNLPWQQWHILSAELSLVIIALHVGMHWKWIATFGKKYLLTLPKFGAPRREEVHGA